MAKVGRACFAKHLHKKWRSGSDLDLVAGAWVLEQVGLSPVCLQGLSIMGFLGHTHLSQLSAGPRLSLLFCSWQINPPSLLWEVLYPFCSPPPDLDAASELSKSCVVCTQELPELCLPFTSAGLPVILSTPGALGFPCQGEGSCFHPLWGAHIQNTSRIFRTAKVPGLLSHRKSQDTKFFGLCLPWAANDQQQQRGEVLCFPRMSFHTPQFLSQLDKYREWSHIRD